jgi:Zn-dependent M28 family amino/carboxypeptidase
MHDAAAKITAHAKGRTRAWSRLAEMVDRYPHRLSGSKGLEGAIDWAVETMKADGLANARRQKVMVPHWVRGHESLRIVSPGGRELEILTLGGSVGTRGTMRGEIAVVDHVDQVKGRDDLEGKILLINQVMPPYDHEKMDSGYGTAVQARTHGASEAAKKGAKAVLVRSVTANSLNTPHTGSLRYDEGVRKIPAVAVTPEGAQRLARMAKRGPVKLELKLGAKTLPDAVSGNAIAELVGREKPDEIVVIGGHIDAWDVGDGAHDDGSGCLMAMEAALMLHELGLVPRRTIRVVLFTNEENGLAGARAYFEAHGDKHVAAIEADAGSGAPQGFSIASPSEAAVEKIVAWSPLFAELGADHLRAGWGGADISPLIDAGVLGLAVRPDGSQYFDYHHSPADTIDKVDPDHLQRNAAAMALMAYLLAERQ